MTSCPYKHLAKHGLRSLGPAGAAWMLSDLAAAEGEVTSTGMQQRGHQSKLGRLHGSRHVLVRPDGDAPARTGRSGSF